MFKKLLASLQQILEFPIRCSSDTSTLYKVRSGSALPDVLQRVLPQIHELKGPVQMVPMKDVKWSTELSNGALNFLKELTFYLSADAVKKVNDLNRTKDQDPKHAKKHHDKLSEELKGFEKQLGLKYLLAHYRDSDSEKKPLLDALSEQKEFEQSYTSKQENLAAAVEKLKTNLGALAEGDSNKKPLLEAQKALEAFEEESQGKKQEFIERIDGTVNEEDKAAIFEKRKNKLKEIDDLKKDNKIMQVRYADDLEKARSQEYQKLDTSLKSPVENSVQFLLRIRSVLSMPDLRVLEPKEIKECIDHLLQPLFKTKGFDFFPLVKNTLLILTQGDFEKLKKTLEEFNRGFQKIELSKAHPLVKDLNAWHFELSTNGAADFSSKDHFRDPQNLEFEDTMRYFQTHQMITDFEAFQWGTKDIRVPTDKPFPDTDIAGFLEKVFTISDSGFSIYTESPAQKGKTIEEHFKLSDLSFDPTDLANSYKGWYGHAFARAQTYYDMLGDLLLRMVTGVSISDTEKQSKGYKTLKFAYDKATKNGTVFFDLAQFKKCFEPNKVNFTAIKVAGGIRLLNINHLLHRMQGVGLLLVAETYLPVFDGKEGLTDVERTERVKSSFEKAKVLGGVFEQWPAQLSSLVTDVRKYIDPTNLYCFADTGVVTALRGFETWASKQMALTAELPVFPYHEVLTEEGLKVKAKAELMWELMATVNCTTLNFAEELKTALKKNDKLLGITSHGALKTSGLQARPRLAFNPTTELKEPLKVPQGFIQLECKVTFLTSSVKYFQLQAIEFDNNGVKQALVPTSVGFALHQQNCPATLVFSLKEAEQFLKGLDTNTSFLIVYNQVKTMPKTEKPLTVRISHMYWADTPLEISDVAVATKAKELQTQVKTKKQQVVQKVVQKQVVDFEADIFKRAYAQVFPLLHMPKLEDSESKKVVSTESKTESVSDSAKRKQFRKATIAANFRLSEFQAQVNKVPKLNDLWGRLHPILVNSAEEGKLGEQGAFYITNLNTRFTKNLSSRGVSVASSSEISSRASKPTLRVDFVDDLLTQSMASGGSKLNTTQIEHVIKILKGFLLAYIILKDTNKDFLKISSDIQTVLLKLFDLVAEHLIDDKPLLEPSLGLVGLSCAKEYPGNPPVAQFFTPFYEGFVNGTLGGVWIENESFSKPQELRDRLVIKNQLSKKCNEAFSSLLMLSDPDPKTVLAVAKQCLAKIDLNNLPTDLKWEMQMGWIIATDGAQHLLTLRIAPEGTDPKLCFAQNGDGGLHSFDFSSSKKEDDSPIQLSDEKTKLLVEVTSTELQSKAPLALLGGLPVDELGLGGTDSKWGKDEPYLEALAFNYVKNSIFQDKTLTKTGGQDAFALVAKVDALEVSRYSILRFYQNQWLGNGFSNCLRLTPDKSFSVEWLSKQTEKMFAVKWEHCKDSGLNYQRANSGKVWVPSVVVLIDKESSDLAFWTSSGKGIWNPVLSKNASGTQLVHSKTSEDLVKEAIVEVVYLQSEIPKLAPTIYDWPKDVDEARVWNYLSQQNQQSQQSVTQEVKGHHKNVLSVEAPLASLRSGESTDLVVPKIKFDPSSVAKPLSKSSASTPKPLVEALISTQKEVKLPEGYVALKTRGVGHCYYSALVLHLAAEADKTAFASLKAAFETDKPTQASDTGTSEEPVKGYLSTVEDASLYLRKEVAKALKGEIAMDAYSALHTELLDMFRQMLKVTPKSVAHPLNETKEMLETGPKAVAVFGQVLPLLESIPSAKESKLTENLLPAVMEYLNQPGQGEQFIAAWNAYKAYVELLPKSSSLSFADPAPTHSIVALLDQNLEDSTLKSKVSEEQRALLYSLKEFLARYKEPIAKLCVGRDIASRSLQKADDISQQMKANLSAVEGMESDKKTASQKEFVDMLGTLPDPLKTLYKAYVQCVESSAAWATNFEVVATELMLSAQQKKKVCVKADCTTGGIDDSTVVMLNRNGDHFEPVVDSLKWQVLTNRLSIKDAETKKQVELFPYI